MTDIQWRHFDYLIASAPGECPLDIGDTTIMNRVEMSPRDQWLVISEADALLIVMDDAQGLKPTSQADVFEFSGNRLNFDNWMAAQHPSIAYEWLDRFIVAFADRGAQASFDNDLAQRGLRADHLACTV